MAANMTVNCVPDHDQESFLSDIYPLRRPVVLQNVCFGKALEVWTPGYLAEKVGSSLVKVHVCPVPHMDFLRKNFQYKTLPFNKFIQKASQEVQSEFYICPEEKYYLRSIGDDPRKDIADISKQFPAIADDFRLPDLFPKEQFFSSVFRIGSQGMQLWTHYDVMDNFLVQITGRKRVVLFSPEDALNMYLNGDKSEVLDIDNPDLNKYPNFAKAKRYECYLEPGDMLFIPALWFHNVISLDFSIAVNIFWKHLDDLAYDKKDVYGNKDPLQATKAMQMVDKGLKALEELPDEYRDFYSRRMISKIYQKGYIKDKETG